LPSIRARVLLEALRREPELAGRDARPVGVVLLDLGDEDEVAFLGQLDRPVLGDGGLDPVFGRFELRRRQRR